MIEGLVIPRSEKRLATKGRMEVIISCACQPGFLGRFSFSTTILNSPSSAAVATDTLHCTILVLMFVSNFEQFSFKMC